MTTHQTDDKPARSIRQLKRTTELEMPSGFTAELRRPPLATWIASGRVPDSLMAMIATGGGAEVVTMQGDAMKEVMALALEMAKESFVWPRIVEKADAESDDELEPGQLSLEDLSTFLGWVFGGTPGALVAAGGGEVSIDAVRSFRPNEQLQSDSGGGGQVQAESGGDAGNQ
jgi:hypothetical protein